MRRSVKVTAATPILPGPARAADKAAKEFFNEQPGNQHYKLANRIVVACHLNSKDDTTIPSITAEAQVMSYCAQQYGGFSPYQHFLDTVGSQKHSTPPATVGNALFSGSADDMYTLLLGLIEAARFQTSSRGVKVNHVLLYVAGHAAMDSNTGQQVVIANDGRYFSLDRVQAAADEHQVVLLVVLNGCRGAVDCEAPPAAWEGHGSYWLRLNSTAAWTTAEGRFEPMCTPFAGAFLSEYMYCISPLTAVPGSPLGSIAIRYNRVKELQTQVLLQNPAVTAASMQQDSQTGQPRVFNSFVLFPLHDQVRAALHSVQQELAGHRVSTQLLCESLNTLHKLLRSDSSTRHLVLDALLMCPAEAAAGAAASAADPDRPSSSASTSSSMETTSAFELLAQHGVLPNSRKSHFWFQLMDLMTDQKDVADPTVAAAAEAVLESLPALKDYSLCASDSKLAGKIAIKLLANSNQKQLLQLPLVAGALQQQQAMKAVAQQQKQLNARLLKAICKGPAEEVQRLLRAGADPNAEDAAGRSAIALVWGSQQQAEKYVLLLQQPSISIPDILRVTWSAARVGGECVRFMYPTHIRLSSKLCAELRWQGSLLNWAVSAQHQQLVELLLQYYKRNKQLVAVLSLRSKLQTSDGNCDGECECSCLQHAVHSPAGDCHRLPVLQLLLNSMRDSMTNSQAAALLETSNGGYSPLQEAASHSHQDCVAQLLAAGADPEAKGIVRATALHIAAERGHVGVLQALLQHIKARFSSQAAAAIVDARSDLGWSPLMVAAYHGHQDCVVQLLSAGADACVTDADNSTALHLAAERGQLGVIQVLLPHIKARFSSQAAAALVDAGDFGGWSPLIAAARTGHQDCVVQLLSAGADPCVTDSLGRTALHTAAESGHLGLVQVLLQHQSTTGTMLNRDSRIGTPLMLAAAAGKLDVVKALITAGADTDFPQPFDFPEDQVAAAKCVNNAVQKLVAAAGQDLQHRITAFLAQQHAAEASSSVLPAVGTHMKGILDKFQTLSDSIQRATAADTPSSPPTTSTPVQAHDSRPGTNRENQKRKPASGAAADQPSRKRACADGANS